MVAIRSQCSHPYASASAAASAPACRPKLAAKPAWIRQPASSTKFVKDPGPAEQLNEFTSIAHPSKARTPPNVDTPTRFLFAISRSGDVAGTSARVHPAGSEALDIDSDRAQAHPLNNRQYRTVLRLVRICAGLSEGARYRSVVGTAPMRLQPSHIDGSGWRLEATRWCQTGAGRLASGSSAWATIWSELLVH
jgi:hypothetical protein